MLCFKNHMYIKKYINLKINIGSMRIFYLDC